MDAAGPGVVEARKAKAPWTVELMGPIGSAGDLARDDLLVIGAGAGLPSSLSVLKQVATSWRRHVFGAQAAHVRVGNPSVEDLLWCWDTSRACSRSATRAPG